MPNKRLNGKFIYGFMKTGTTYFTEKIKNNEKIKPIKKLTSLDTISKAEPHPKQIQEHNNHYTNKYIS